MDNISRQPRGLALDRDFQFRSMARCRMIKAAGGAYWSAYFADLDAKKVKGACAGPQVLAWTVNDPVEMAEAAPRRGWPHHRPRTLRVLLESRGIRWR
jgi:hypothetical protein